MCTNIGAKYQMITKVNKINLLGTMTVYKMYVNQEANEANGEVH